MNAEQLRELLLGRLYMELQLFKDSKLQQEKEEIFQASYKIEIYVNLYEIFAAHMDNLQEDMIRRLLSLNFGILEFIYQEWLSEEDGLFSELQDFACSELKTISESGSIDYGKEHQNGTKHHQAAESK